MKAVMVLKEIETGKIVGSYAPFLPPTRVVWAVPDGDGWQEVLHRSDCAVHNAPAYPPGPCDCEPMPVEASFCVVGGE